MLSRLDYNVKSGCLSFVKNVCYFITGNVSDFKEVPIFIRV